MSGSQPPGQPRDRDDARHLAEAEAVGAAGAAGSGAGPDRAEEERSRRRVTRIMLVVLVVALAILGAEIAYFISVEQRRTEPAPSVTQYEGWQQVRDSETHGSYRVPPQFLVEDPLQRRALGQELPPGPDRLALRSTATLPHSGCAQNPDAVTALAGFVDTPAGGQLRPPEQVARDAAAQSLTHRDGTVPALPEPTASDLPLAGGGTARAATLQAPVTEAYPCSPPELRFTVVQFELRGQPMQFLLASDAGDTERLDAGVESRILQSLGAAD